MSGREHSIGWLLLPTAVYCALLALYTAAGGWLFDWLEGEAQLADDGRIAAGLQRLNGRLASELNELMGSAECLDTTLCGLRVQQLIANHTRQVRAFRALDTQYGFYGWAQATLFAFTAYTTIGYGYYTPRTPAGRWLTLLYTILGLPLMIVFMNTLGTRFHFLINVAYVRARRLYRRLRKESTSSDGSSASAAVPIWSLLLALVVYVLVFSVGFHALVDGGLGYGDVLYFLCMSMSTVGLGDVRPASIEHMLGVCVFVLGGMVIISICTAAIAARFESAQPLQRQAVGQVKQMDIEMSASQSDASTQTGTDASQHLPSRLRRDRVQPAPATTASVVQTHNTQTHKDDLDSIAGGPSVSQVGQHYTTGVMGRMASANQPQPVAGRKRSRHYRTHLNGTLANGSGQQTRINSLRIWASKAKSNDIDVISEADEPSSFGPSAAAAARTRRTALKSTASASNRSHSTGRSVTFLSDRVSNASSSGLSPSEASLMNMTDTKRHAVSLAVIPEFKR